MFAKEPERVGNTFLTIDDICDALGISDYTLRDWRRRGMFPNPSKRSSPQKWHYIVFSDWLRDANLEEDTHEPEKFRHPGNESKWRRERWLNLWYDLSTYDIVKLSDISARERVYRASIRDKLCCRNGVCCPRGTDCIQDSSCPYETHHDQLS